MVDEYLTNEEKVDALSMPIKDIIKELEYKKLNMESANKCYFIKDIKLYFAIIYHLEQAYKNKAEYY